MKNIIIYLLLCIVGLSCKDDSLAAENNSKIEGEKDSFRASIPQPVFSAKPEFVDLYWKAWELAKGRVKHQDGIYQSPYMDENLWMIPFGYGIQNLWFCFAVMLPIYFLA